MQLGHHALAVLLVEDVVHRRVLPDVLEPKPGFGGGGVGLFFFGGGC
jgi:hypothetical protein